MRQIKGLLRYTTNVKIQALFEDGEVAHNKLDSIITQRRLSWY